MKRLTVLALLTLPTWAVGANTHRGCAEAVYEAWSTVYTADGSNSSHDRSTRYCLHGGRAEIAEYRGLGPDGQVGFHGVSVTLWNPDRQTGRTLWAMVGVDGWTDIQLHWAGDDELRSEGVGHDPQGHFLERWTTRFKPGGDEHFVMSRSYDAGLNWQSPTNVIEYLHSTAQPPALPQQWSKRLASVVPQQLPEGGMILLDGNAWGQFQLDDGGAPQAFRFDSVAPKDGGWVWRSIRWSLAEGITEVVDQPLQ